MCVFQQATGKIIPCQSDWPFYQSTGCGHRPHLFIQTRLTREWLNKHHCLYCALWMRWKVNVSVVYTRVSYCSLKQDLTKLIPLPNCLHSGIYIQGHKYHHGHGYHGNIWLSVTSLLSLRQNIKNVKHTYLMRKKAKIWCPNPNPFFV